jgi:hypothetical protein
MAACIVMASQRWLCVKYSVALAAFLTAEQYDGTKQRNRIKNADNQLIQSKNTDLALLHSQLGRQSSPAQSKNEIINTSNRKVSSPMTNHHQNNGSL